MYHLDCQFLSKEYAEYMEKTIRIAYTYMSPNIDEVTNTR